MRFLVIVFILFCTIKSLFYAKYEIEKNNNSTGGIIIGIISVIGLLVNSFIIFK